MRAGAVVLLLGAAGGVRASAQMRASRPVTLPLTLAAAVDSALRNSPDLLISRSIGDSARAEQRIARALPNPQVAAIPNTPFQYSATIALDVGPQRWQRARVAGLAVDAATADTRDVERQLTLSIARLYDDVLLADARRRIVTARREIMRQLVVADSARVRVGDLPERALIRSQVELIKADADAARSAVDAETTRLLLQGQMGIAHPDSALALAGSLEYQEIQFDEGDAVLKGSSEWRPDVMAARARESQSAASQRLAAASLIPIPQLSYVQQFGAPFQTGRYSAIGIGFELPFVNGYRGQRERAAAGHTAASVAARRADAQAEREITLALAEFRAQRGLVRRYKSGVLGKVAQNVEATRYAYARGAASLLEVLDALRVEQDVMTDYYTALHDYWVSTHSLRAAMATPIF